MPTSPNITENPETPAKSEQPKAEHHRPAAKRERTFSRERVLGPDGEQLAGVAHHTIVGALHGDDRDEFTREQLRDAVDKFLKRPVGQGKG